MEITELPYIEKNSLVLMLLVMSKSTLANETLLSRYCRALKLLNQMKGQKKPFFWKQILIVILVLTFSTEIGIPTEIQLRSFEGLLADLKNTDLFIMVDVTKPAANFVEKMKNMFRDVVVCMKK